MPRGSPRLRTSTGMMNQIGERVRERRLKLKVSQSRLCALLATHTDSAWNPLRGDIVKIEQGRRTVTDLEVMALAAVLQVGPCWLFLGESPVTG